MRRATTARLTAGLAVLGCVLTACTTGPVTDAGSPSVATAALTPTGPTTIPTVAPPSPTTPSTPSPSTPAPTSTPAPIQTASGTSVPADYCTAAQLRLQILPGGASLGYEIAAVAFTNTSTRACSLSGFPTVQLRRGGTALATATPRAGTVAQLVHLDPGMQAQAQIRDKVDCQAPLSESIHAAAPAPLTSLTVDSTTAFVQLRGCTVTIDPIVLSS